MSHEPFHDWKAEEIADEAEENTARDRCDFEHCPGEVVAWADRGKWCYAHALGMWGER